MLKRITSLIFFNSYTPPQHALTHIIDKVNSTFCFKIKEALHINWRKPNFNVEQNHSALQLSLQILSHLCSFLSLFFAFLFHVLFSLSLTLIISIFYCLNYPSILLYFITTLYHTFPIHLQFALYLTLIIGIFYCFNYTLLLRQFIIIHLANTIYNKYIINIYLRQLLSFI